MESRSSISIWGAHVLEVGTRLDASDKGAKKMKYAVGNRMNATMRLITILVGFEATITT